MKKLKLTNKDKEQLVEEFKKSLDSYGENNELKINFEKEMTQKPEEKLTILFTPLAFLKSQALVKSFNTEIGWQGLMKKMSDKRYLVYDIIVYPQSVNGARTLDPTKNNDWYEKYIDVIEEMRFQAHSHVEMSTSPSMTDINNQRNIVKNTISGGFMLFQIWNKKGDINSFFYDIDEGLLYDRNDITVEILGDQEFNTLKEFVTDSKKQVKDMESALQEKVEAKTAVGYQWKPPAFWSPKTEEKEKDPFYWNDGNGHEGWGRYT